MQGRVVEVSGGVTPQVRLEASGSELVGLWRGAEPPSSGQDCDVELGCTDLLRWSDDRTLVGDGPTHAPVTATVENVQEDGVAVLRLLGAILLVDLPDGPRPPVGAAIRLEGVTLEFWPTHV